MNWNRITFLESAGNLKSAISARLGRTPSTSVAREIAVCVQQGRLFFQSAERSAIEIRPLLLYYGTVAFSKALVASQTLRRLGTLPASHGISDISAQSSRITELVVKIGARGTFQEFNNTVSRLNRFVYFEESMPRFLQIPAAPSIALEGFTLTLKDILARIPPLARLYSSTFREPAKVLVLTSLHSRQDNDLWELRIDDPDLYSDRASLVQMIRNWRQQYPCLEKWRLTSAQHAWGNSVLLFSNIEPLNDEFAEERLPMDANGAFISADRPEIIRQAKKQAIADVLSPPAGSFGSTASLIAHVQGTYPSEYSLHYLGMFLLSSLVRYRPQTWVHSVTRSATEDMPADDQALALIEAFMETHAMTITTLVAEILAPER